METHPGAGRPVLEALPEALSTWTTGPSEMADWRTGAPDLQKGEVHQQSTASSTLADMYVP